MKAVSLIFLRQSIPSSSKLPSNRLNPVVHAADIPYVFGPSITPYLNAPLDIALSLVVQKAYLSFAAHLSPNVLGDLVPGVSWPLYYKSTSLSLLYPPVASLAQSWKLRDRCVGTDYSRH
jgi:hypothetical protein